MAKPSKSTLATRLLHARSMTGLTARGLSVKAKLKSKSHVGQIERGQLTSPRFDTLTKIAEALGADPYWLLTGEGEGPVASTKAA